MWTIKIQYQRHVQQSDNTRQYYSFWISVKKKIQTQSWPCEQMSLKFKDNVVNFEHSQSLQQHAEIIFLDYVATDKADKNNDNDDYDCDKDE